MNRFIVISLFLICQWQCDQAKACDQCSCSSGAAFNNISEFATYNYLLLRLGYGSMHNMGDVSSFAANANLDIVGGYSLNSKLHLSAYLPIRYNYFEHDGTAQQTYGIGDAGLLINTIVWTNASDLSNKPKLTLSLRGGVEFPTGKFNKEFRADDVPAATSTGSSSFDFLGGGRLIMRKGNNAITADYIGKYNTENAIAYQFGFQQSASLFVSRSFKKPGASWLPYTGVTGEFSTGDTYHDLTMAGTSGYHLALMAGVEYARTNWVFGAHADFPVIAQYDTDVTIHPKASFRVMRLFN